MKALIIGATGATGKDLLQKLIDDTHFSEIHVFGRRALELRNNKVFEHIVDFDQPETWKKDEHIGISRINPEEESVMIDEVRVWRSAGRHHVRPDQMMRFVGQHQPEGGQRDQP